jgi:hypothetical protein
LKHFVDTEEQKVLLFGFLSISRSLADLGDVDELPEREVESGYDGGGEAHLKHNFCK